MLGYALPGKDVTIGDNEYSVPDVQVLIFNSARYATYIHEGTGKSSEYGERPFLQDGLDDTDISKMFNEGFSGTIHD